MVAGETSGDVLSEFFELCLLKKNGLSRQTVRPYSYKTELAEEQRWRDEYKKETDTEGCWIHYRGYASNQGSASQPLFSYNQKKSDTIP